MKPWKQNPVSSGRSYRHRIARLREQSLKPYVEGKVAVARPDAILDCGWGRVLFGQTFQDLHGLTTAILNEGPGRRDIAMYVRDPHVILAQAPQELFLDPSHTYRLDLSTYRPSHTKQPGYFVRRLSTEQDAEAVNRIYVSRKMVPVRPDFFWSKRDSRAITYFVAEDSTTGSVIGTVTGIDHGRTFDDPEKGSSLWCLAVDGQAQHPGIGEALVRRLSEHFQARGALYMDLSVMHDNEQAISLYEKLGFRRVPFFAVKRKNLINEKLFSTPSPEEQALNPYARIITDEARRRGIGVDVVDSEGGFFRLTYGGRSIACRESLTELTSAVAMSICDDKTVTRRIVERAGVHVPAQIEAGEDNANLAFLNKYKEVVVKPARGEQGKGIAVGLKTPAELESSVADARKVCDRVLVEECVSGHDLRIIIIDYKVVAAAVRRPATIVGNGEETIENLISRQSRRRAAATGGESTIPLDSETERCIAVAGYSMDSVIENGENLVVRKTANLHTGGTIHDVTGIVHRALIDASVRAARAINIPVTGIDFIVRSPSQPDYWFIEANERPGLANHEPQPTAERFIDLLFPQSMPADVRGALACT